MRDFYLPPDDPDALPPPNLAQYGFAPVMLVAVPEIGCPEILWQRPALLDETGMVYAAVRADGLPLVVGAARGTLEARWRAILGVIAGESGWRLGAGEAGQDPRSWVPTVLGHQFQVWARKSLVIESYSMLQQDAAVLSRLLLQPGLGTSADQQTGANLGWSPSRSFA